MLSICTKIDLNTDYNIHLLYLLSMMETTDIYKQA